MAFLVLGIICHLVAFIRAIVNACQKGRSFPSYFVGGLFVAAGNLFTHVELEQFRPVSFFPDVLLKAPLQCVIKLHRWKLRIV